MLADRGQIARMNPLFGNLRSDVSGIVWPPLARNTAALIHAYAARLSETQWLDPAEIAAHQRRQLGVLAQHCAQHSPAFAARLAAAGLTPADLAEPGGLQRLPPLTRQAMQRTDDLYCREVPNDHMPLGLNSTSGSTGEPVKVHRTALNHLGWMAMTLRDHQWQRRDSQLRLAGMSAHFHAIKAADDWGPPISTLFETGPGLSFPATLDIARMLPLLREFRPQILVTYPSVLGALLDRIEREGSGLDDLRHVRCMSEMVSPDLRVRAQAQLGIRLEDAYSSEECGFIALQCPDDAGGYHAMAETIWLEIVDDAGQPCAPGEMGRVLVTDLHNFATPLIRYDIGDFAVAGGACPCGRGLPRIERIVGRERNLVCKPDGSRHWPLTGYPRYRAIAPVRQYQLIQHDLAIVEMRLVTERTLTADEEAGLAAQVCQSLGHDFAIRFVYFSGRLPLGTGGKFEEFVSHVKDRQD